MISIKLAVFLISAAALGLELVLVRVFSIGHWYHFSYLVISTALLGFAGGGTLIASWPALSAKYARKTLWICACGFGASVPVVLHLSQKVGLDELQLIWDWHQMFYLFAYYLLFFIPFFFAGICVALAFTICGEKAHSLYFYNMAGAGFGVAVIAAMMYGHSPEQLFLLVSAGAFSAAIILVFGQSRRLLWTTIISAAVWLIIFSPAGPAKLETKISENKSLSYYRVVPEAQTLAVRYSPLARLDCVAAPSIRNFPGLSIAYRGPLPEQVLIISDGDGVTTVNHFENLSDLACYGYMTSALAYHMSDEPVVCVIGAGGGADVCQAIALNAHSVTAVEMNPQIVELVSKQLDEFASGLYSRDDVEVVIAEGRSFLQTTEKQFDIINISLLDSPGASAGGGYALSESHLYTVEAIEQGFSRLKSGGILSITRMLKTPPRDSLKMFATVTGALKRFGGVSEPGRHIIMIRNWSTATITASAEPFTEVQIAKARDFATQRSFDLVYLPGIEADEVNRYHVLDEPVYYQGVRELLSRQYESFCRDYMYNIRPATDDRPYFFDFFKLKALPFMVNQLGDQWLVFSEWGYLILAATLVQSVIASGVLILLPLFVARPVKAVRSGKCAVAAYFLLLGFAYMFIEMGFIQKLTLLTGRPVFGMAVTLVGFLFFSGIGSFVSGRWFLRSPHVKICIAASAVIVIGLIDIAIFKFLFGYLVSFSQPMRILLGLMITAPPAFFMGMPFPSALKELHKSRAALVPWAWGVNGFASVTGAVLGTILAISLGFTILTFIALGCYFLAAVIAGRICYDRTFYESME